MGAMLNEDRFGVASATFNVAACAAQSITEQNFTVRGLRPGDFCHLNAQGVNADGSGLTGLTNIGIAGLRVSAPDTLTVRFDNPTAGSINPGNVKFLIYWFRGEKVIANAVS